MADAIAAGGFTTPAWILAGFPVISGVIGVLRAPGIPGVRPF
jgi:hypothetical protein